MNSGPGVIVLTLMLTEISLYGMQSLLTYVFRAYARICEYAHRDAVIIFYLFFGCFM